MKKLFTTILSLILTLSIAIAGTSAIAQPANDLIENAIDLAYGPIPYIDADVDFPNATNTNDGTNSDCELTQSGVWYKFTANKIGTVAAGILNPIGAVVIFFEGGPDVTDGSQLTYVDQQNNPCDYSPLANIQTTPGTTYYIYMRNTVVSDVIINAEAAFSRPENDLIENATNVNNMIDFNDNDIHFLMATFTGDNGQIDCSTEDERGVWYKFTAEGDGQVVAGINSDPSTSALVFYTADNENATSGADLTYVGQPSNPCDFGNLSSIMATAGNSYYLIAFTDDPYATVSLNLSGILGNTENELEGFVYYPNPIANELNLSAKSSIDEIGIFNLMGQKVLSEKPGVPKTQIDLSHLSTGLYIMNVTSDGVSATYRLLKE